MQCQVLLLSLHHGVSNNANFGSIKLLQHATLSAFTHIWIFFITQYFGSALNTACVPFQMLNSTHGCIINLMELSHIPISKCIVIIRTCLYSTVTSVYSALPFFILIIRITIFLYRPYVFNFICFKLILL